MRALSPLNAVLKKRRALELATNLVCDQAIEHHKPCDAVNSTVPVLDSARGQRFAFSVLAEHRACVFITPASYFGYPTSSSEPSAY
jgi:hypothetical protein